MSILHNPIVQNIIITCLGAFIVRELNRYLTTRQKTYNRGYKIGKILKEKEKKSKKKIGKHYTDRIFGAIKNTAIDFLSGVVDGYSGKPPKVIQNKGNIVRK